MSGIEQQALRAVGVTGDDAAGPLAEALAAGAGPLPVLAIGALSGGVLASGCALLLAPDIGLSLGLSTRGTGALLGLWSAGVVLAFPFALRAGLGQRRLASAVVGGSLLVLSLVLLAFASAGGTVAAAAGLAGVGAALAGATHRDLLRDLYPPLALTQVLALHRATALAGGVVGLIVAFPLATATGLSWRGALLVLAGLIALATATVVTLDEPQRGAAETGLVRRLVGGDTPPPADRRLSFGEALRRLYAIPSVRPLLATYAVLTAAGYGVVVFGSYVLTQPGGLVPVGAPLVIASCAALAAAGLVWGNERASASSRTAASRLTRDALRALLVAAGAVALAGLPSWWPATAVALAAAVVALAQVAAGADRVLAVAVPANLHGAAGAVASVYVAVFGVALGGGLLASTDGSFGLRAAMLVLGLAVAAAALPLRTVARAVDADVSAAVDRLVEVERMALDQARGKKAPLLTCRKVNFSYGPLQILFDVDFSVDDGEMVALLGTNGAGKSTLLRVISGLGTPSAGTVRLRGEDITYAEPGDRVRLGVSQIPGGKAVFGPLTVAENLRMYGYALGRDRKAIERGIEESFAAFPRLAERRNSPASTMSGGEQQMLALSKALIVPPRLLLIDELSLGLAPKVVGELLDLVRTINASGTAVVLVEQSVNVALSLAEHAYFMEKGQVRFDGRTEDLLARPDILRSVFLSGVAAGAGA